MYIVMSTSCTERPSLWCRCRSLGTPSSALAPTIASPSTTPFEGFRNLRKIFLHFVFLQVVHKQPARKLHRLRQRDNLLKRQPGKRKWTGGQNDVIILLWYSSTHKILLLKNDTFQRKHLWIEQRINREETLWLSVAAWQQVLHGQCEPELSGDEAFDKELGGDHPQVSLRNVQPSSAPLPSSSFSISSLLRVY